MKSFLSVVVAILFIYIQLFNGMVWLRYEVNKSQIIEKFCVNKDRPQMHCNGTCHMKKMMLTKDEKKDDEKVISIPQINLYPAEKEVRFTSYPEYADLNTPYRNFYRFRFLNDEDIPPKG